MPAMGGTMRVTLVRTMPVRGSAMPVRGSAMRRVFVPSFGTVNRCRLVIRRIALGFRRVRVGVRRGGVRGGRKPGFSSGSHRSRDFDRRRRSRFRRCGRRMRGRRPWGRRSGFGRLRRRGRRRRWRRGWSRMRRGCRLAVGVVVRLRQDRRGQQRPRHRQHRDEPRPSHQDSSLPSTLLAISFESDADS